MRAVLCEEGRARLESVWPVPAPTAGEARIRVRLAGICATDQAILKGYASFSGILGHEFVGEVESAPDAPEWVGRRVVGEITVACGVCSACRRLERGHCEARRVMGIRQRDGVFADWVVVPVENLHVVPEGVSDRMALFTEPLAAAVEIVQQSHVRPTDRVVVIGDGKLGLLVAQVVALTGCELWVIGRHVRKWPVLEARRIPVLLESALPDGLRVDWVMECSGRPEGLALARRLVRPRGRVVLKSAHLVPLSVDLAALVVDEISWIGSRCGPFPAALRLLERELVTVEPLIEAVYRLDRAMSALEHANARGALKILLQP
ncbi:MAG: alcohol dehydrogenase catalytic domain-containing protein [Magnetococcales bacterium]|nr:alcohol dehydrogenase catalytic domain-containing protein [Magnetococcales bacterium]